MNRRFYLICVMALSLAACQAEEPTSPHEKTTPMSQSSSAAASTVAVTKPIEHNAAQNLQANMAKAKAKAEAEAEAVQVIENAKVVVTEKTAEASKAVETAKVVVAEKVTQASKATETVKTIVVEKAAQASKAAETAKVAVAEKATQVAATVKTVVTEKMAAVSKPAAALKPAATVKNSELTMPAVVANPATHIVTATNTQTGDAVKGKALARKCMACHAFTDKKKMGPGLKAIMGRKAGSMTGMKYSEALASGNWSWNETNLGSWLCNSKTAVKELTGDAKAKTKMPAQRICDADKQADMIAFLKTL